MPTIDAIHVPLMERDGVLFVEGTRVPLDTIVAAFERGESAEEIVDHYSTLRLKDVYLTIGYYLANKPVVESYLEARRVAREEMWHQIEAKHPPEGIRARLLSRKLSENRTGS